MKKRLGDILKFILFIGIGIFCIYWFLLKLSPDQKQAIWQSFREANYWWVAVAMACCLLSHLFRALRWKLLYKPLDLNPSLFNTYGAVVVTYMANLAFPRLGEVMRCAVLRTSDRIPIEKSLGTVVTERIIDTLLFLVIAAVGMLVMYNTVKGWLTTSLSDKLSSLPSLGMLLAIVAVLAILAFVVYKFLWKKLLNISFFQKIDTFLQGCVDGLKSIFHLGKRNAILFTLYSLAIYALYIMGGLIIFQAFNETVGLGFEAAFVLYLFGSVGMGLSQGGIGVYPVLVQMGLAIYGISLEVGTACGWILWGSQQLITIVVGMFFLIYFAMKKRQTQNSTQPIV